MQCPFIGGLKFLVVGVVLVCLGDLPLQNSSGRPYHLGSFCCAISNGLDVLFQRLAERLR